MSVMPLLEAPLRGGDGVFDEGVVVESDLDRDQMNHLSDSSPRAPEGRAGGRRSRAVGQTGDSSDLLPWSDTGALARGRGRHASRSAIRLVVWVARVVL